MVHNYVICIVGISMKKLLLLSIAANCFLNASWGTTQKQISAGDQLISFANKASIATGAFIMNSAVITTGLTLSGLSVLYYGQNFLHERKKLRIVENSVNHLEDSHKKFCLAQYTILQNLNEQYTTNSKLANYTISHKVVSDYCINKKNSEEYDSEYNPQYKKYAQARNKFCFSLLSTATFAGLWWWKNYYSK